ncbi:hypothetical protein TNCV_592531 [Trichonephila clavipes]|nr:hypothetical protein TNCV_592531 [Trichonephila clavipes]
MVETQTKTNIERAAAGWLHVEGRQTKESVEMRHPFFGGVRGTPRNSSACKQQQGLYTNYCCNPYGKAAPITPP